MQKFISAKEVAEILNISLSLAYKIVRNLNIELEKMGYFTVHGKVSRKYFEKKFLFEEG